MSDDETVFVFLNRREQELTHQIAALRGQIEAKENELSYVKKAKAATAISVGINRQNEPSIRTSGEMASGKYETMTIKQLVVQALLDHFPNGGTLAQIRDFMRDGYGRQIEPSSLRPQMHRLKADGVLGQDPSTDTWNFQDGKRPLYARYDHPTSRTAMKELQDDETSNQEAKATSA